MDLQVTIAGGVMALGFYLVGVTLMVAVSAVHDFVYGPLAGRAEPGSLRALHLRRRAALLARANAGLALMIVAAAVRLARGG